MREGGQGKTQACAPRRFIELRRGAVGGLVVVTAAAATSTAAMVAAAATTAAAVVATWHCASERDCYESLGRWERESARKSERGDTPCSGRIEKEKEISGRRARWQDPVDRMREEMRGSGRTGKGKAEISSRCERDDRTW